MAFPSSQTINIVTCPACQGAGCLECSHFGVYGLLGEQTLTFNLPSFLEVAKRKKVKTNFLIKRGILVTITLIIVVVLWLMINSF